MKTTGIEAFVQMLADFGVRYLFGNPGTTELPLSDALAVDSRIKYILGLQEVPVMAMADGYAMATRSLGVVNLHISCGVGNAMGMLYNAFREGTPLLVTAGQQDRRLRFEEPILYGDMLNVVRPWTKWAVEVQRISELPSALSRAVQAALTPPTGPVFISLPVDLQTEVSDLELRALSVVDHRTRPPAEALRRAAAVLAAAKNPAILAGSRVVELGAVDELVSVAERLGAPVYSEPGHAHGRQGFPPDHPLYGQALPLWAPEIREQLAEFDLVFAVGIDLLRLYVYFEPSQAIPNHVRIVHLDEDPYQIGKNYPVEIGLLGSCQAGLRELNVALAAEMNDQQTVAANDRAARWTEQHAAARRKLVAKAESLVHERPMAPLAVMHSIARVAPPNLAIVEEAVTSSIATLQRLGALRNPTGYFAHRGWALGWGLGCALGVKLAWPERPVLAVLGEGAAMYGIQGLWSAARYRIPVTFVVCNNAQYQILKAGARSLGLPNALAEKFVGMELRDPEIDFVQLAKALGVDAERIHEPDQLAAAVRESLSGTAPKLLDVPIQRTLAGPG